MNLSFLESLKTPCKLHAKLADYTTFQLGGPCLALLECRQASELISVVRGLRDKQIPFLIMGFGSNILASDQGVESVIVRYFSPSPIIRQSDNSFAADASTQLDDLASHVIQCGFEGMTEFSGIPGTLGGAIAGNAGAYGKQIADHLKSITLLRPDSSIMTVPASAIRFQYRDSEIKHSDNTILSADFLLNDKGDKDLMLKKRQEILSTRRLKHGSWQETPCAGSFFRNIEPSSKVGPRQSAGWFLEQAGCKELNFNGAHPFTNHANIVTHEKGATALDVYRLSLQMTKTVKEKFGIDLIREVRLMGKFTDDGNENPNGYW